MKIQIKNNNNMAFDPKTKDTTHHPIRAIIDHIHTGCIDKRKQKIPGDFFMSSGSSVNYPAMFTRKFILNYKYQVIV